MRTAYAAWMMRWIPCGCEYPPAPPPRRPSGVLPEDHKVDFARTFAYEQAQSLGSGRKLAWRPKLMQRRVSAACFMLAFADLKTLMIALPSILEPQLGGGLGLDVAPAQVRA